MESKSRARVKDRISELPDSVIRHILSFAPTKCAVRTSALSTRWKDMWTCVSNLYLTDKQFSSSVDFMEFVDRALLVRDSTAIGRFHLHFHKCHDEDLSRVVGWLQTAVRCNVVELDLSVVSDGKEMVELPKSLMTCKTLEAWNLVLNDTIKIPTSGCCPKLKFLYVMFSYPDYGLMDFSQFPALEHLRIGGSLGYSGFSLNISVPTLKTLRINLDPYDLGESWSFLISSPKLEKFDLSEGYLSNYTFLNTKSLVEASIDVLSHDDVDYASPNVLTTFLAGISGVKRLTFSFYFLTVRCQLPVFESLSNLTLPRDCLWWDILMRFLERSPNLESFVISHKSSPPTRYRPEQDVVTDLSAVCKTKPDFLEVHWNPPESVPSCLLSSLKTVTIMGFRGEGFSGYLAEMKSIKYLLKKCLVLEKMTVYTPGLRWGTTEEFYNDISESEWGSKTVQVEMIRKEFYRDD